MVDEAGGSTPVERAAACRWSMLVTGWFAALVTYPSVFFMLGFLITFLW